MCRNKCVSSGSHDDYVVDVLPYSSKKYPNVQSTDFGDNHCLLIEQNSWNKIKGVPIREVQPYFLCELMALMKIEHVKM